MEHLSDRFRVVLPDLPLHGDSERRPHHSYSLAWLAEVMAGFAAQTLGPRPLIGGHGAGAEILIEAVSRDLLAPARLVLMPCRLHRATGVAPGRHWPWRAARRAGGSGPRPPRRCTSPGPRSGPAWASTCRRAPTPPPATLSGTPSPTSAATSSWRSRGRRLRAQVAAQPAPRCARRAGALHCPTLLLWADEDRWHPLADAEEALDPLPEAQLRVLAGTGFLMAYDDPVGVARELAAFCG